MASLEDPTERSATFLFVVLVLLFSGARLPKLLLLPNCPNKVFAFPVGLCFPASLIAVLVLLCPIKCFSFSLANFREEPISLLMGDTVGSSSSLFGIAACVCSLK